MFEDSLGFIDEELPDADELWCKIFGSMYQGGPWREVEFIDCDFLFAGSVRMTIDDGAGGTVTKIITVDDIYRAIDELDEFIPFDHLKPDHIDRILQQAVLGRVQFPSN